MFTQLNAAANHGYLPRNGIASIEQTVSGLGKLYNLGPRISAVLAAFAVATEGNPVEGVWSIPRHQDVGLVVTGGQHQDRDRRLGLDPPAHLEPVEARKHHVEDDEVGPRGGVLLDRTRAVQVIPFDDHLAEGAEIDLELVGKATRKALLELAAMVADDFNGPANPGEPRH